MARRSSQKWQAIIEQQEASGSSVINLCEPLQVVLSDNYPDTCLLITSPVTAFASISRLLKADSVKTILSTKLLNQQFLLVYCCATCLIWQGHNTPMKVKALF